MLRQPACSICFDTTALLGMDQACKQQEAWSISNAHQDEADA